VAIEELSQFDRMNDELPLFKPQQSGPYGDAVARPIQLAPDLLHCRGMLASHCKQYAVLEVGQFRRIP